MRSGSELTRTTKKKRLLFFAALAAALAAWLAAGVRRVPEGTIGVLDGPLVGGSARRVGPGIVLAPNGLLQLTAYPTEAVELGLPQAEELLLQAADGSRFGFRGWLTLQVNAERWRELHAAARGGGLQGVLIEAAREAGTDLKTRQEELTASQGRELELKLQSALAARGVVLLKLDLDSIDFLASEGTRVAPAAGTRLLVIGLDGADWAILDDLLRAGRLPHLGRLIETGVRAKLLSISPMLSPVIWTSVATGVPPSRHGILDFLVDSKDGGQRQPVTSAQRRVPTVWELLSRASVPVGIVGWWASWPADAVRGYLVSDRIAYQLFGFRSDPADSEGKTWPPDLYAAVQPLIVSPSSIGWERVVPFLDGARKAPGEFDAEEQKLLEEFRTLLASGETYLNISLELERRQPVRLAAVYFEGTDTVGHLFMPYRPPPLAGVARSRIESFGAMVDRYYEEADRFIGRLLEGRDDSWTVMVLSDHGFASDATRPRTTDSRIGHGRAADWHRKFGVLVMAGAGVRRGVRLEEASVYDIAPTILALFGQPIPRSWPGQVLGEALAEEFLAAHPVAYRTDDPQREGPAAAEAGFDPAAADLIEKLESLGYVGGGQGAASARNNSAVALMAEGRFADAERELRAAWKEGARGPMIVLNLALCLQLQDRDDEAVDLFRQALEHPGTLRIAGNQLAQILLERQQSDEAEALVRRVLAKEPDAAEVRNTLGSILERRGDLDDAGAEYRRAAELDPDSAHPRNSLGNLAKARNAPEEAERWYLRAIEADPYFMGSYNNLALIYQARGDMKKAIDLYGRALAKAPQHEVVLNNLASLYFTTGDFVAARRLWTELVRVKPSYVSPLNNLAGIEITEGRPGEAEPLLRRALELDPTYGDARINLALVLAGRGNVALARAELERAAADPRAAAAAFTKLGALELSAGRAGRAVEALERALAASPRPTTAVLNALGEAYLKNGMQVKALEVWRRSLAIDPRQAVVRTNIERLARSPQSAG